MTLWEDVLKVTAIGSGAVDATGVNGIFGEAQTGLAVQYSRYAVGANE